MPYRISQAARSSRPRFNGIFIFMVVFQFSFPRRGPNYPRMLITYRACGGRAGYLGIHATVGVPAPPSSPSASARETLSTALFGVRSTGERDGRNIVPEPTIGEASPRECHGGLHQSVGVPGEYGGARRRAAKDGRLDMACIGVDAPVRLWCARCRGTGATGKSGGRLNLQVDKSRQ
jgi:hypothetical protein